MKNQPLNPSSWWRLGVVLTVALGLTVEVWIASLAYNNAPPIPDRVVSEDGELLFTGSDILSGQEVFLKSGLMENGSVWGHGAYLGPDFAAAYLHELALDGAQHLALLLFQRPFHYLAAVEQEVVQAELQRLLKQNRYQARKGTLVFTTPEALSFGRQVGIWKEYFADPTKNRGLKVNYLDQPEELRQLTAFFAWTAWVSVANRPGETYSYTNNFPYEPLVGNRPPPGVVLWSALSLITLLAGTAVILFAFGRFDYLGWRGPREHLHAKMLPGAATRSQQAIVKYFVIVSLLFLVQVLVGAATAHNRAEPGSFYGLNLYQVFPSNLLRTWHLQLAIFWIATAYVAGALFLAASLGEREPWGQAGWINALFWVLALVVGGSILGEWAGISRLLGDLWFWFGHQGWEYLDLGRGWQVLLAAGLIFWIVLLWRYLAVAVQDSERREISSLFLLAALAIPVFYLPAFFFGRTTNLTVVDNWRFWIIHLWVEGYFELLVTVMVAVTFFQMGLVSRQTATRVIYLDAILFLGSGIIGTGHHWYWTGQTQINLALAAMFSAMEVVPLTLLTLDAWDFVKVTRGECDVCGQPFALPHKWTFYFLMAVGFWNFLGAGIFGFLINLPIVSYFEVGTILTPNHGHAALMGAFGMEAVALLVLACRQVLPDDRWARVQRYIGVSFWGLNIGLALMVAGNLFPAGVLQFYDVLTNGYWHARGPAYLNQNFVKFLEWCRMPGDLVFIFLGVVPLLLAVGMTYLTMGKPSRAEPVT